MIKFKVYMALFALNVLMCSCMVYTGDYHIAVLNAFGALLTLDLVFDD